MVIFLEYFREEIESFAVLMEQLIEKSNNSKVFGSSKTKGPKSVMVTHA
jgi:hypothetical protein